MVNLGFICVTIWVWCFAVHVIGIGSVKGDQLCSMESRRVTCGFHVFVMIRRNIIWLFRKKLMIRWQGFFDIVLLLIGDHV